MKYINRLQSEIKKERKHLEIISQGGGLTEYDYGRLDAFRLIDSIVDSLQKEQLEVDLEKESLKYFIEIRVKDDETPILCDFKFKVNFATIARHFFELGLNARKEEQL